MKKRGFTIIELLVIISIIGLISSVALANLQGSRERAKIAAAQLFRGNMNSLLGSETAAAWDFNEGVVGNLVSTIQDGSGNNNTGTVVIPSGAAATYVNGVTSNSTGILLTGGAYIGGGGVSSNGGNPVTVAAWVKPLSSANIANIFRVNVGACNSFMMGINSARLMVGNAEGSVAGSDTASIRSSRILAAPIVSLGTAGSVSVANGKWQLLVATFDSSGNVETYIDGVLVSRITGLATSDCQPASAATWSIGGLAPGSGPEYTYYSGSVDDIVVYNGTLLVQP